MENSGRTAGQTSGPHSGATIAERVAAPPRRNWWSRVSKSIADFFRRRRFSRNRAKLRPLKEPDRSAKH